VTDLRPLIATLDAQTLRHLASLADRRDRERWRDSMAIANELAEIVASGDRPTIGFYRRHAAEVAS